MGQTLDFNPFQIDEIDETAQWAKILAAWIIAYYFFRWLLTRIGRARVDVEHAPQTRGGQVIAGMGSQATAFVAAGLITAVVVSATATLYGMYRDGAIGGWGASTLFSDSPFTEGSAIVTGAIWVIEKVFPLQTALSTMLAYLTFELQVQVATAAATAIKRYLNP